MKNKLVAAFLVAVFLDIFRIGPIPQQVEPDQFGRPGRVIVRPDLGFGFAGEDGSFMFLAFAGCLPWRSCAINEPTDWWIGSYK